MFSIKKILYKFYYKLKLDILFGYVSSWYVKKYYKPFSILTVDETINRIIEKRCSISRFGDGELLILAYGYGPKFQREDKNLQKRLKEIVLSPQRNDILIGLSDRLNLVTDEQRAKLAPYWRKALNQHLYMWTKDFSRDRIYGNANITRLTDKSSIEQKIEQISLIKKIWSNRIVIVVEGNKTRFGVGNDLLDNANSVFRILGPAESAFDKYDEILDRTLNLVKEKENTIVLIALGPTATVLAYDLACSGIQAIDIGHLDICYEQLKLGGSNKVAIPGKYTNEAADGTNVSEINDPKYINEISYVIK